AGGLAAILAGYAAHRLFSSPPIDVPRRTIGLLAALLAGSCLVAFLLAVWLDRVPRLLAALALAAAAFAAAAVALRLARPLLTAKPAVAVAILVTVTTIDLAYNNGPSTSSALPPSTYDVLEPRTGNAAIALLRRSVVQNDHRRDRIE